MGRLRLCSCCPILKIRKKTFLEEIIGQASSPGGKGFFDKKITVMVSIEVKGTAQHAKNSNLLTEKKTLEVVRERQGLFMQVLPTYIGLSNGEIQLVKRD
jgi:hypothetical protein